MRNYKVILLLFALFFLSGCTIKYDIYLDENLNVKEDISIKESFSNVFEKGINNPEEYLNEQITKYQNISNLYKLEKINDLDTQTVGALLTTETIPKKEYIIGETLISRLFPKIKIEESGSSIIFNTESSFVGGAYIKEHLGDDTFIELTIIPKHVVTSNNADGVDLANNRYTWLIDSNSTDLNIELIMNKEIFGKKPGFNIFSIFGGIRFSYIVLVLAGLSLIGLLVWMFYSHYLNNRI